MPYFIFAYLIFMSLIVLYFLHSTSVLSFYMDVVFTFSMEINLVSAAFAYFVNFELGL